MVWKRYKKSKRVAKQLISLAKERKMGELVSDLNNKENLGQIFLF